MAQFDELITILKEILNNRFYPKPEYIKGVLGDGLGNVRVPNRADYNYARFNRGAAESFEVFNKTVPEVEDWPVLIGQVPHQPGLIQVVGTDWESYSQSGWGDSVSTANPHAPTHVWRDGFIGADPLSIYMRAIAPGRAYTTSATGTIVYVNSFEYHTGTIWPGTPGVDLQPLMSSLSTGSALFAGVYVDPTTNALGVITGTADVDTAAFDPPLVTFPWGVIPKARVRLYGGQGGLRESDFRDARRVEYVPFTGTVDSDEKVKVSSNDTTPNYLISKMSVDEPLTLVQDNDGGDEDALFGVDLSTLTEETAPADTDIILLQRASDSAFRKVAWSNVGGGSGIGLNLLYDSIMYDVGFQEYTSRSNTTDDSYTDLWNVIHNAATGPTVSRQAGGASDPFDYYRRVAIATNSTRAGILQFLSAADSKSLRGETVSLSFDIWGTGITGMRASVLEWTGTADALTSDVVTDWDEPNPTLATNWAYITGDPGSSFTVTGTRARITIEGLTVGSSVNNLAVFIRTGVEDSGDLFNIARVKLEIGATATDFVRRDYGEEKLRIYDIFEAFGGDTANERLFFGQNINTTQAIIHWAFHPKFRIPAISSPDATLWSLSTNVGGLSALTSISFAAISRRASAITATVSGGQAAGDATLFLTNSINARIYVNARL